MKRWFTVVLVMVLALSFVSVGAAGAKAPGTGDRTGDLNLWLNWGAIVGEGPHQDIVWFGTATFDDVDYGVVYYTVTTHGSEVTSHWTETWDMYDYHEALFLIDEGVLIGFNPGEAVVSGTDSGMTHWKNFTWVGNGSIDMANAPFEEWEGHRTHISGDFDLAAGTASGTVRFN
jgi:hypothetical protein